MRRAGLGGAVRALFLLVLAILLAGCAGAPAPAPSPSSPTALSPSSPATPSTPSPATPAPDPDALPALPGDGALRVEGARFHEDRGEFSVTGDLENVANLTAYHPFVRVTWLDAGGARVRATDLNLTVELLPPGAKVPFVVSYKIGRAHV